MARRKNLFSAATSGSHEEMLVALRARIAKEIQDDPEMTPRDLATLSRQLREINKELAAIQAPEGDFVDHAQQQPAVKRGASPF